MAEAITEDERLFELQEARRMDDVATAEEEKTMVAGAAKKVAAKLNNLIEAGHDTVAFTIILALAIFKDGALDWVLDFMGIGEIPILGQIPGAFVTITLYVFTSTRSNVLKRFFRKRIILLIADLLPLLNNFPLTTAGILWMWYDARKKADEAEADLENLKSKTKEELKRIEKELDDF